MAGTVLYERTGRIATITYNRPEALNAINGELREDLDACWAQFREDDEAWVGIVTGAGRAFSAGADLRSAARPRGGTHWETPSLTSLENGIEIWKPTIAAVNGYCLGFACTLVAGCDFVIASERAEFGSRRSGSESPPSRALSVCPRRSAGRTRWNCCSSESA